MTDKELKQKVLERIAEEKQSIEQENLYNHFSEDEIYKAEQSQQDGDAWIFSQLYKNKVCFDHTDKQWMIFKDHYWQKDPTNEVITKLDDVIDLYGYTGNQAGQRAALAVKEQDKEKEEKYENKRKNCFKKIAKLQMIKWKNEVLALASSGTRALAIEGNEWDKDPMTLGCVNGVINLRTGGFRDGKPEDYIRAVCPTPWKGIDKECPRWIKFLEDIFDGKKELISFIQRLLGYSITGLSKEHIFPICWGNGRNGKGTLFELLGSLLGNFLAEPIEAEMLLAQQRIKLSSGPSPDIMALRGKRIVWASETDRGRKLNIAKLKWLVGGDTLVGRNLHSNQCSFKPSHTLFLFTNHRPRANPDDDALWERIFLTDLP
jgi:putative DNA primase/helicase